MNAYHATPLEPAPRGPVAVILRVAKWFTMLCAGLFAVALSGAPQDEQWTVTVKAFDPFGRELAIRRSEILTVDHTAVVAKSEGRLSNVVQGARFGEFILRVHSTGGSVGTRRISINGSRHYVIVGLPIRFGDSTSGWPGYTLRIKLGQQIDSKNLWVAAQAIFLDFRREAVAGLQGLFILEGLDMGSYLVQIFRGNTLLHVQGLQMEGKGNQELTIPSLNLEKK